MFNILQFLNALRKRTSIRINPTQSQNIEYILPITGGNPDQVLKLGQNRQLEWKDDLAGSVDLSSYALKTELPDLTPYALKSEAVGGNLWVYDDDDEQYTTQTYISDIEPLDTPIGTIWHELNGTRRIGASWIKCDDGSYNHPVWASLQEYYIDFTEGYIDSAWSESILLPTFTPGSVAITFVSQNCVALLPGDEVGTNGIINTEENYWQSSIDWNASGGSASGNITNKYILQFANYPANLIYETISNIGLVVAGIESFNDNSPLLRISASLTPVGDPSPLEDLIIRATYRYIRPATPMIL